MLSVLHLMEDHMRDRVNAFFDLLELVNSRLLVPHHFLVNVGSPLAFNSRQCPFCKTSMNL